MTSNTSNTVKLSDLETVLDVCGSDPRRWPEPLRSGLLRLVDQDTAANQLLREAEALDRLLAKAPDVGATQCAALADRIVAAALREQQAGIQSADHSVAGSSANSATPAGSGGWSENQIESNVVPLRKRPSRSSSGAIPQDGFWAGAALAACLMLGVMLGQSQMADPVAELFIADAGQSISDDDAFSDQLALIEDDDLIIDEDLL